MKHIFKQGKNSDLPTLFLLHGTGGTEHDLLNIGRVISTDAPLLSVRGNIVENGMPRFFKCFANGTLDEEDLVFRTNELNQFLNESADTYQFNRNHIVAVGYSNGANIAASLLLHHENALHGAILFHPLLPRRGMQLPNLSGKSIFIGAGKNDPLIRTEEATELAETLQKANADVHLHWENHGHQLTGNEIHEATHWFKKQFS